MKAGIVGWNAAKLQTRIRLGMLLNIFGKQMQLTMIDVSFMFEFRSGFKQTRLNDGLAFFDKTPYKPTK